VGGKAIQFDFRITGYTSNEEINKFGAPRKEKGPDALRSALKKENKGHALLCIDLRPQEPMISALVGSLLRMIGQTSHYRIVEKVGGGMGVLYKAEGCKTAPLSHEVHGRRGSQGCPSSGRFQHEAQAA